MLFFFASLLVLQACAVTTNYQVNLTNSNSANGFEWVVITNGTGSGSVNPTITANVGDTLIFSVLNGSDAGSTAQFAIHTANNAGSTSARISGTPTFVNGGSQYTLSIVSSFPSTLYYVSENPLFSNASGTITITYNCYGLPGDNVDAGNCSSTTSANGTVCTPTCSSGFSTSGDLTATCVNGVWQLPTSSCVATSPTPSPDNNEVTYVFTIDGTTTQNCNYMSNTVIPNLNDYLQQEITGIDSVSAGSALTDCNNNDNNNGATWTITVTISGSNADNVVQSDSFFANLLELQLQSDSNVDVTNVDVTRSSGFFVQASVLALASVVLTALMA